MIPTPEAEGQAQEKYVRELRGDTIRGQPVPEDYIQGASDGFERGVAWARKRVAKAVGLID